uniref:Mobile element protein n=1 Tax=Escherichia coli TaxID=562 RepID=A0A3G1QC52_ECOLX|nr:Mobile element protein [Escherichia coli]
MQAALDHLRAQGETLNDEDIARLSPLCHRTYQYARPLFLHAGRTGEPKDI